MLASHRYNPSQHPSLPPGCYNNPIEYTLSFQMSSVHILEISPRPVYIKINLWGIQQNFKLESSKPLIFNVRTNESLLGKYLRDMKVCVIKLHDQRNNGQLGAGVLNWALFMRKTQIKGSPFIQDSFEAAIPIFTYKKRQIAEIQMGINLSIFKQQYPQSDSRRSSGFDQELKISILGRLQEKEKQKSNRASNKDSNKRNTKDFIQEYNQRNKKIVSQRDREEKQQGYENKIEGSLTKMKIKQSKGLIPLLNIQQMAQQSTKRINYPQSKYEKEKAQLKLEAEEFLILTRKENQLKQNIIKSCTTTVRIYDLAIIKASNAIEYIDLHVLPKKQSTLSPKNIIEKKHMRIFSNGKESNNFEAEISLKQGKVLEIQIGKGLAKASIEAKTIKQKQINVLPLYGKNGKWGSIKVAKLYELNQNTQKPQIVEPTTFSFEKVVNSNKTPQKAKSPQINSNNFLLIYIKEAKHDFMPYFDVAIKNYVFSKPYPSSNIIPISELGSVFAIQMRNENNETVDSTIIKDYNKIPIVQQNLRCIVLRNGLIKLENGVIKVEILMGTIKQINYELAEENSKKIKYPSSIQQYKFEPNKGKQSMKKIKAYTEASNYNRKQQMSEAMKYEIMGKEKLDKQPKWYLQNEYNDQQNSPNSSNSKVKQEIGGQVDESNKRKYRKFNKKTYTDGQGRHLATESASYIKVQNEGEEKEDNIYLVEVLSKFLHALPVDKITETSPNTVQEFENLLYHFLSGRQQKQLIQVVMDMFIDDISIEEGQPPLLEYDEFIKCLRGYHNFVELWWKMRVDTLSQIIKLEPDYANRIAHYSELGMISKQKLWEKALNKVNNPELQLKVDKIYNISLGTPIPASLLIQDLKNVQNSPQILPREATPELIMDLGKLIKQTIQSILQGSGIEPPNVAQDKVNIRVMCDTLERLHITLSYWESLMLIQQLKGWYSIDLDLNEGIVSGSTVEGWLKSVLNRSAISEKQMQNIQAIQKERPLTPKSNTEALKKPDQVLPQIKNIPEKISNSVNMNKVMQNKSAARSQLNEDEIFNIANLLRDNDDFRIGTLSSQKPISRQYQNNTKPNDLEEKLIENNNILDKLSEDDSESIEKKVYEKKRERISKEQVKKEPKYLYGKIKSLKLKNSLSYPIKLVMKVFDNKETYFLCKQLREIQDRQIVQELPFNWHHKSKGLRVEFHKIPQTQSEMKDSPASLLLYGVLLNDEINDLVEGQMKTKTIVLYGNKEIVGKLSLEIQVTKNKLSPVSSERKTKISVEINPQLKNQNQWQTFHVKAANWLDQKSQMRQDEVQFEQVAKNQQFEIEVDEMFYKQVLQIEVQGVGTCTVPLQQLYFKSHLVGEYPVIANEGQFMSNLQIRLANPNTIVQPLKENQSVFKVQNWEKPSNLNKYLIIFDSIATLLFNEAPSDTTMLSNIYVKDAITRSILYRSSNFIEHVHPKDANYSITSLSTFGFDNYCIIEAYGSKKQITVELEYNGRPVGIGEIAINLSRYSPTQNQELIFNRMGYLLKYVGTINADCLLSMGIRVIGLPVQFQKYKVSRILQVLSKHKSTVKQMKGNEQTAILLNEIFEHNKLTITEQRLLKIATTHNHGSIYVNSAVDEAKHDELVQQLLYVDQSHSGKVEQQKLQQIVEVVIGEDSGRKLINSFHSNFDLQPRTRSPSTRNQYVNYLPFLEFTYPIEAKTYNYASNYNNSAEHQSNSYMWEVDRLHEQIKNKYSHDQ